MQALNNKLMDANHPRRSRGQLPLIARTIQADLAAGAFFGMIFLFKVPELPPGHNNLSKDFKDLPRGKVQMRNKT